MVDAETRPIEDITAPARVPPGLMPPDQLRVDLSWSSHDARHVETWVGSRLGRQWPAALLDAIRVAPAAEPTQFALAADALVPAVDPRLRIELPASRISRRLGSYGPIIPRVGRFYPQAIVDGADGLGVPDGRPLRVLASGHGRHLVDLNHPLAGRELSVTVTPGADWAGRNAPAGENADTITGSGSGMQARRLEANAPRSTDFFADRPFARLDPRPDAGFYAQPRLVDHLDATAMAVIGILYGNLMPRGGRILDLMSSWHSHLPDALAPAAVIGLGMNQAELNANPLLTERLVHDLNQDPRLPIDDASVDGIVSTVSVEYLTRPFEVFRELGRVLRPGGRLCLTFSNRWFPPKVIAIWQLLHEFERMGLVLAYLLESGLFTDLHTWSLRGLPRPADDRYADRLRFSDPVYAVWGSRCG
jgi:SAM-dependent methyltransferase